MPRRKRHTRRSARLHPRGVIHITHDGYGFVKTAEGEYFISASQIHNACDGDVVEVIPHHRHTSHEGSTHSRRPAHVSFVISRAHTELIGRYEIADPFGVIIPLDNRIPFDVFSMHADHPEIADGSLVRARIDTFPSRSGAATGTILEVLGDLNDPHAPIEAIIARHHLPVVFSPESLEMASSAVLDVAEALSEGYRDERDECIYTIDPSDAKDFDDAISISEDASGIHIGVYIADVSHYVPALSPLDEDARKRSTSVYLCDRVIPMLPAALSNELCSLKPGVDRRTIACRMTFTREGKLASSDIYRALIRSKARLSYDMADACLQILESSDDTQAKSQKLRALFTGQKGLPPDGFIPVDSPLHHKLVQSLRLMDRWAQRHKQLREHEGALMFQTVESRAVLDEEGRCVDVALRYETRATSMIEEAMLAANECVARYLRDTQTPALFRIHEAPDRDVLAQLAAILGEFDVLRDIPTADIASGNPHAIIRVLDAIADKPGAYLISQLCIRAMKRATYSAEISEHYGLASECYCHFTSPIRRYPDLIVHRMLTCALTGRFDEGYHATRRDLSLLARITSECEYEADRAARESHEYKFAEYMQNKIGQDFSGIVSGVTSHGVYIRLDNTIEGFVPVRSLGDEYFAFDGVHQELYGTESARRFGMGNPVHVRLVSVSPEARRIEFRILRANKR